MAIFLIYVANLSEKHITIDRMCLFFSKIRMNHFAMYELFAGFHARKSIIFQR